MLSKSDFPIEDALGFFTGAGIEAAFFVPTETAMRKSIIDAHDSLRGFLKREHIHDFEQQLQGTDAKAVIDAQFVTASDVLPCRVSLYRPTTKSGDPRFWIYGLSGWADANNLVATFIADGVLTFCTLSDPRVWAHRNDADSPLHQILERVSKQSPMEAELLDLINSIARQGFVRSLRTGDTGIGFTLESLLGIDANSSKSPDYKGIELKAARSFRKGKGRNRVTLFSQVPDWSSSRVGTALELVETFGYLDSSGRQSLYCTTSNRPNPQSLYLVVEDDGSVKCMSAKAATEVVRWDLTSLEHRLAEKHASTFWVKADVAASPSGDEYFHFRQVIHSRRPILANLGPLIQSGRVTMDFTVHVKENGRTRDHGYLFKIDPQNLDLLFPPPITYDLAPKTDFVFIG